VKKAIEIFCSYVHEDQQLLLDLKKHLRLWEHQNIITVWTDMDIAPGTNWEQETAQHLSSAHIILLLISPDFLASDYCYSTEMTYIMERYERGEVCVIPIILRHCAWEKAPFGKIQALPTNREPITSKNGVARDKAFLDIAEGILQVAEALTVHSLGRENRAEVYELASKDDVTEPAPNNIQTMSQEKAKLENPKVISSFKEEVQIFLNYRRNDSTGTVGRIYEWLQARLSPEQVFLDVYNITAGTNIRQKRASALSNSIIVLVIIGKSWLQELKRRKNTDDYVVEEISEAIRLHKFVIPLCIEGATMPDGSLLPPNIKELASLNSLLVRHDPDFNSDMRRVRSAIQTYTDKIVFHNPVLPPSQPAP
jgi:TIR domain